MMTKSIFGALALALIAIGAARAQSSAGEAVTVTVDNFTRAESDLYLASMVKDGSLGRFLHRREPAAIDNQTKRSRANSEDSGVDDFFGKKKLPLAGVAIPGRLLTADSSASSEGKGSVNRSEALQTSVAGVVTQVLPNGNLVVEGRQEVRVNYEIRELIARRACRIPHTQVDDADDVDPGLVGPFDAGLVGRDVIVREGLAHDIRARQLAPPRNPIQGPFGLRIHANRQRHIDLVLPHGITRWPHWSSSRPVGLPRRFGDQQRLQDGVEEAQQEHDGNERPAIVTADAGNDPGRNHDSQREHDPAHEQLHNGRLHCVTRLPSPRRCARQ